LGCTHGHETPLHWADDGTVDALAYLARRLERFAVLVIGTYRDDELEQSHPLRTMPAGRAAVGDRGRTRPLLLKSSTDG
jgi:hypothetical protein